ncbi:hypothetical protein ACJJTC_008813, partial [Scirpophaga incertulas]
MINTPNFREERRQILELVGPELQSTYDDRYIEFEFVDMHYGTDGGDEGNPALLRYHLDEIRCCNQTSKAGYFLCLLGGDASSYQPVLPYKIADSLFERLVKSESAETDLIRDIYQLKDDSNYHLTGDEKWYSNLLEREGQRDRLCEVQKAFSSLVLEALEHGADVAELLQSPVELQCYITCSEFGLTELELLELLMPTSNSEAVITLKDANFNFSTLCVAKYMMKSLITESVVSGRSTWRWAAGGAGARARRRYVRVQAALRDAHSDLAALHFAHFLNDADDTDTSDAQEPGCVEDDDALLDSTPFHSASRTAAAFTQRHVEESWLHLLLAGDFSKLKDLTVCNFDFLLAAVQTVTISYLRCILEHVRCYILDRDVELVYGAVRKSSDILTRDPMQLGAQIIAWLRPAVARRGVLATLVTSAMAWCDGYDKPLLVPLNGWLQPPIASTVRVVSVAGSTPGAGARLLQLAPSGQHLVLAPSAGDPQLWHVMSNSRVHTFKGHSGRILCMCVTRESQYLLTGSEDTSVIVWDLLTLAVRTKIL